MQLVGSLQEPHAALEGVVSQEGYTSSAASVSTSARPRRWLITDGEPVGCEFQTATAALAAALHVGGNACHSTAAKLQGKQHSSTPSTPVSAARMRSRRNTEGSVQSPSSRSGTSLARTSAAPVRSRAGFGDASELADASPGGLSRKTLSRQLSNCGGSAKHKVYVKICHAAGSASPGLRDGAVKGSGDRCFSSSVSTPSLSPSQSRPQSWQSSRDSGEHEIEQRRSCSLTLPGTRWRQAARGVDGPLEAGFSGEKFQPPGAGLRPPAILRGEVRYLSI
eukprot:TRINITY_DN36857_c0_g1_i1.p1 TRINITY_DN36857_c0_g1~~TRINITY_DN36857_c0_g1_i1.p1  ORF type:complete len:279 (+),score=30.15 TRINITY_DN36857_c0_g1_i1:194-1030(+)